MYTVNIAKSQHQFEKKNLVTIPSPKGGYDDLVCTECGIKGKSYTLGQVEIPENYNYHNAVLCKAAPAFEAPNTIEIIHCRATGEIFSNITPKSQHKVVDAPDPYENDYNGVWVMGVGEPVKVLSNEYKKID